MKAFPGSAKWSRQEPCGPERLQGIGLEADIDDIGVDNTPDIPRMKKR
jgi:hypothetical protein